MKDKLIVLTIILVIAVGPIAAITIYWTFIKEFIGALWTSIISSPELQQLIEHMIEDKITAYIITNIAYFVFGIILYFIPIKINGMKVFRIIYGCLFFIINEIIAVI